VFRIAFMHAAYSLAACLLTVLSPMAKAEPIKLYAAGSLKAALTEVARAFEAVVPGATVETEFAASGLLRERIEKGETAHVFASADTGHPKKLSEAGKTRGPVRVFARNELCALAKPGLTVSSETLLSTMLDPSVRLGMSTPKADPSGDYALELFTRAEAVKPGAKAALEAKALQLTGGPTSPKAPDGRNLYAWVLDSDKADLFVTYCTNAVLAKTETATLTIVAVPAGMSVGAAYGLTVIAGAPTLADRLAEFIAGGPGQAILAKYGFGKGS